MARKRNARGQFVKGGGGSSRGGGRSKSRRATSSTTSTALVRAAPAQIIRVSAPRAPAKKTGGTRSIRRYSGGGDDAALNRGLLASLKKESKGLIGSAAYGWVTASGTENATKIKEYLDKVPTLDTIGKPATHGLLALFGATRTKGWARTILDALAKGALYRATYNFGANGFDLEKAAAVGADDEELSGEIQVD